MQSSDRRVGSSYKVPPIDPSPPLGPEEDDPMIDVLATPPITSTAPLRVKKQKRRYPQLPTFDLPFPLENNNNNARDKENRNVPSNSVRLVSSSTRPSVLPVSNSWPSLATPSPAAQLKFKASPNTPSTSGSRGSSVSPIVTPRRRHPNASTTDNTVAFPALPFTLEPTANQRVRFTSPSQPSVASMATRDGRRSSEFSREAATSTGSWQQRVAEQVIRLSLTPSDASSPAPLLRRTTSRRRAKRTLSGDVTSTAPVTSLPSAPLNSALAPKRGNASHKRANSYDKENTLLSPNVHVVKQESFADEDRIRWPFPGPEPELTFGPTRQRNPRTPTVSVSHPDYAGDSDVDEVITVFRPPPPSSSPPALSPPSTPPRRTSRTPSSGARSARAIGSLSPLSATTDDSPVPSRHRLSSYVIESSSLFFMPRSHPPSDEAGPSSSTSPQVPGPSSRFSDSTSGHDPTPAPGGVRLLPRVSEAVGSPSLPFVGKGKKRMSEEEEAIEFEQALALRPPAEQRQRVESNMTKYTDDDTIAELPTPRKRMKVAHPAFTSFFGSSSSSRNRRRAASPSPSRPPADSIGRARSRSASESPNNGTQHTLNTPEGSTRAGVNPSRASSRRSPSVSFTLQGMSPPPTGTRSRRAHSLGSDRPTNTGIPIMAFIRPRPASFLVSPTSPTSEYGYHIREPRRYSRHSYDGSVARTLRSSPQRSERRSVSRASQVKKPWTQSLPLQGWAFFIGFLLPFVWWAAALSKIRYASTDDEQAGTVSLRDIKDQVTWRRRCRLVAGFSLIVYIPVIVLAAIFGR